MNKQIELIFLKANSERKKGNVAEAGRLYRSILQQLPNDARALKALAGLPAATPAGSVDSHIPGLIALFNGGRFDELVNSANALLQAYPDALPVLNLLGAANARLNRVEPAMAAYARAIAIAPTFVEAHNNLGIMLMNEGRLDEAAASMERAAALKPDFAEAHNGLGAVYLMQGKADQAQAALERALRLNPGLTEAHNNMGNIFAERGEAEAAATCYRQALRTNPRYVQALNNLGNMLRRLGSTDEAWAVYHQALEIDGSFAEAQNGIGNILAEQGRIDEAIVAYRYAVAVKPNYATAYRNLGNVLMMQRLLEEAVHCFARAAAFDPGDGAALAQKLLGQAEMGDWTAFAEYPELADRLAMAKSPPSPFSLLAFEDDPARNRLHSERYAAAHLGQTMPRRFGRPAARPDRLKVGYFSADFHDHATLRLMAGLFREHDRRRFDIQAYSYGTHGSDAMRERLVADVDGFTDISGMADAAVAALVQGARLDLAVDLKGHTRHSRSSLFAAGLAPVQISYLGYPGTIGAPFIDYIIADKVVIPADEQPYYCEKVIYLPDSYQVNDNRRAIADGALDRAALGLPDTGFVFCCFNNSYKITAREFDIWMRLLHQIPDAVLWLLKPNAWIAPNLREAARGRGVDPDRLIFAEPMGQAQHLARHGAADLFLDTFRVNAHTTASDALWTGLPVVTRLGRGFAARVAGSLLNAVGLPELVTESDEDYERLASALATDRERLAAIRARLAENRLKVPLFDTARTTRHIEAAYDQAYNRYLAGQEPEALHIL